LRGGILLASTLALTLLALTHPAWAWSNDGYGYSSRSDYETRYPDAFSVYVQDIGTQASLPDALDVFYAHLVNPREVVVMWLGAGAPSGMLLKNHEKVVLIDPANKITGDAVQRLQLDILLITHEHSDHFLEWTPAIENAFSVFERMVLSVMLGHLHSCQELVGCHVSER